MNTTVELPEVRAYLSELQRLLGNSPDRTTVLEDIRLHIEEAAAEAPGDPRLVRHILDELGDPATIAAGASPADGSTRKFSLWERVASKTVVLLLAISGLALPGLVLPIVGILLPAVIWLVGFVLLWTQRAWTGPDKLLGTFLTPALFAAAVIAQRLTGTDVTAATQLAFLAGYALLTVMVSAYLLVRYRPQN